MKNLTEIENWLSNKGQCKQAKHNSILLAQKIRKNPNFDQIDKIIDTNSGLTDAQILNLGINALAKFDLFENMVKPSIEGVEKNHFFNPSFRTSTNGMFTNVLIHKNKKLTLSASFGDPYLIAQQKIRRKKTGTTEGTVGFYGSLVYTRFITSGKVVLSNWSIPHFPQDKSPDDDFIAVKTGYSIMRQNNVMLQDCTVKSHVYEYIDRPFITLNAIVERDDVPLSLEFNCNDGRLTKTAAYRDVSSRIQMMTTFLRVMKRQNSLPTLKNLSKHPDYFVRWHVMREALALNTREMYGRLQEMSQHDPHEDVSNAASSVLKKISRQENKEHLDAS